MPDVYDVIDQLTGEAAALFAEIGEATKDVVGITRDAYGAKETIAAQLVMDFAERHGLSASFDPVGNVHVTRSGARQRDQEILLGSHLDSVPNGGNFDGLAGVIAGLLVLIALDRTEADAPAVRVLGFRGEESPWFGTAYLGSKLLVGAIKPAEAQALRRFDTGRTFADHLRAIGVDLNAVGIPHIARERARAYLELHIEQGPLLESTDTPVGIATALRGNIRYPFAKCFGEYAHSAAVPRHLRHDAAIATAKLIAQADARWQALIEAGHDDLVFTCGILHTDAGAHAMTKVPGEVTFSLNIGATTDAPMQQLHDDIVARAQELQREHAVRFALGSRVGTPGTALDARIREAAAGAARALGIPHRAMPTVGHDAAVLSRFGVPSAVLLMRNRHGSHNPAEDMAMADFVAGVKVLAATTLRLGQQSGTRDQ
jgi:N-carbamoyl-L-amino-acid hydrolase